MSFPVPDSPHHIEISIEALKNNITYIKDNFVNPGTTLSCVIKGNAYGHGIKEVIEVHQKHNNINHFSVYSAYEALEVFQNLIKPATIMVIGHCSPEAMPWLIHNEIEFYLFDTGLLPKVIEAAKKVKKKAKIHFELETGMNRTGILNRNLKKNIDLIKANLNHLELAGLCTHFAGAESIANHDRVRKQNQRFERTKKLINDSGLKVKTYHTACSAAAIRFPKTRMDMVRSGILQFGFWPNQETYIFHRTQKKLDSDPLKRVISWKSKIMTLKAVKTGEFVGYGTSYFANEDKIIAVVPVGYAGGFSRSLSNQARVLVGGDYAPVTGIVNMNCISVDVTHIPNVKVADEVVMIGNQNNREISVASFSEFSNQLNYEVLARLPKDIPRTIVS